MFQFVDDSCHTCIYFRNNQLRSFPAELQCLTSLRELIVPCNRLSHLPDVVYTLHKLEVLLLSDNQIEAVDASGLREMTQLATLDLKNNSISQVPPELGLCSQLRLILQ